MRRSFVFGLVVAASAFGSGVAWSGDETRRPTDTRPTGSALAPEEFAKELAQANEAEIKLGRLGQEKGSTQAIKDYGRHMVDDHSKAGTEFKGVVKEKRFTIPSEPNAEQKATYERLSKLSGKEFDREYAQVMLKDHEKVVAMVDAFAKNGTDPQLKAFAAKILPTLQHHLEMARELEKKIAG